MKITKEDIVTRFNEYNKKYFDGILPPCKCHVIMKKEHTPLGFYNSIVRRGGREIKDSFRKIAGVFSPCGENYPS